jgi:hypothetical protein
MAIFLLLLIPLIIFLVVLGIRQTHQRRQALLTLAQQHNLTFDPDADHSLIDRFPAFSSLLSQGSNQYADNRIHGQYRDHHLLAFDYHYETHSTDSKGRRTTHHHTFSAVILRANLPLKPLSIRPENFFDKITEFFGYDDIDFESAEFSRAFYVKSPDRRWAFDVLHPRAMQYLLDSPRYTLQFDHQHIIAATSRTFTPDQFLPAADHIINLLDLMPPYLVQQQQTFATDSNDS